MSIATHLGDVGIATTNLEWERSESFDSESGDDSRSDRGSPPLDEPIDAATNTSGSDDLVKIESMSNWATFDLLSF